MHRTPITLSVVLVALGLAVLPACSKKVPDEVKGTLDGVRTDARAVALAAAAVCEAQLKAGRFSVAGASCSVNKLPGEDLVPSFPSPAKGTPLESNPGVANVLVSCMVPMADPGSMQSCGMGLGSLRPAPIRTTGTRMRDKTAESNCKASPNDCEEVVVPSQYAPSTETVDLRIVKPVAGASGATVEVTFVLAKK